MKLIYNNPAARPTPVTRRYFMRHRTLGVVIGSLMALLLVGSVLADSCANVSRAPAPCGFSCTTVVMEGNWIWLPSLTNIGVPADQLPPFWGFAPPGGFDSVFIGAPGANGNYQNGFSEWLLGHSAYCLKGVNAEKSHGIVSHCGA
jgi:hypothetical protein